MARGELKMEKNVVGSFVEFETKERILEAHKLNKIELLPKVTKVLETADNLDVFAFTVQNPSLKVTDAVKISEENEAEFRRILVEDFAK